MIYVVVDRLSKYNHFIPLKFEFTSEIIAHAFISQVTKLDGIPKSIISDRIRPLLADFGNICLARWALL